jgi:alpha-L-fucosidase
MDAIEQVIAAGPYQASWDSILARYKMPTWYEDAKFGIFIHWGLYSVPAFGNEWYPRNMYVQGSKEFAHHAATYGTQDKFGYKDFIPRFTAAKFDAAAWVDLFQRAGARYVVPVAEHHDGFAMYDSAYSRWTAAKMGPRRDLIGELAAAARDRGLTFGVSSHRAEHWWFMNGGQQFPSDVQDPRTYDFYGPAQPERSMPNEGYLQDWLRRCCELVDKYQPQVVWFDWWIEQSVFVPYLQRFAAYYYNRGEQWHKGVAINFKNRAFPLGAAMYDIERGQCAGMRPILWQTDTAVSKNSWGYIEGQDYKTAGDIVDDLIDIVSKNGVMLLNIGPRADGTIPEGDVQILEGIGRWLAVNGEAIYGTRPWKMFGEGPTQVSDASFSDTSRAPYTGADIRFTSKDDVLYAIALDWPGEKLVVKSLGIAGQLLPDEIGDIVLLGHDRTLPYHRDARALTVQLPARRPGDYAYVFKIMGKK